MIIIDYNQRDLWSCGGALPGSLIIINYNLRFFVTKPPFELSHPFSFAPLHLASLNSVYSLHTLVQVSLKLLSGVRKRVVVAQSEDIRHVFRAKEGIGRNPGGVLLAISRHDNR